MGEGTAVGSGAGVDSGACVGAGVGDGDGDGVGTGVGVGVEGGSGSEVGAGEGIGETPGLGTSGSGVVFGEDVASGVGIGLSEGVLAGADDGLGMAVAAGEASPPGCPEFSPFPVPGSIVDFGRPDIFPPEIVPGKAGSAVSPGVVGPDSSCSPSSGFAALRLLMPNLAQDENKPATAASNTQAAMQARSRACITNFSLAIFLCSIKCPLSHLPHPFAGRR